MKKEGMKCKLEVWLLEVERRTKYLQLCRCHLRVSGLWKLLIDSSLLKECLFFFFTPFEGEGAEQIGQVMHFLSLL